MSYSLTYVIAGLLSSRRQRKTKLSHGLWLGFTPPAAPADPYRLTLSRPGVAPGPAEVEVVKRYMVAYWRNNNLEPKGLEERHGLKSERFIYTLITWRY